jgi:tetratricopeptide (TPR) repeat protein
MPGFTTPAARALGLVVVLAALANAQAPAAKQCEVDENTPQALARASLFVRRAQGSQDARFIAAQLAPAVKTLTDPATTMMPNPAGRNLVLGRALTMWSMQPSVGLVTKRGPLGFTTNPEGTIDLATTIDSVFKIVETSNPECIATETSKWRRSPAWVAMANDAVRLMSSDLDSAVGVANRAITLNPYAPYAYMVLAYAARQHDSTSTALGLYRKASESAQYDTAFAEVAAQSLSLLADAALDAAEPLDTSSATGAAMKKDYLAQATAALKQLQTDRMAAQFASTTRGSLCRVYIATGDSAALRATYASSLASPQTMSFNDAVDAGVCMSRADMFPEAITFFQAAHTMNPYHRNALGNLGRVLVESKRPAEALPLAHRAVELEPNDPDNLQLLMVAYADIARQAQAALQAGRRPAGARTGTKAPPGPQRTTLSAAVVDSLTKIANAYTDSAVTTNQRKSELAYRVELSAFAVDTASATLSGSVSNLASGTNPVTIHVDFLNSTGSVIASKEQTLNVAPSARARFSLEVRPSTGITAFKYSLK